MFSLSGRKSVLAAVILVASVFAAPGSAAAAVDFQISVTLSSSGITEPDAVIVTGTFTVADPQTYTCNIDYGEGGLFEVGTIEGGTCTGQPHHYRSTGRYVVQVFMTQGQNLGGGYGIASLGYLNQAPWVGGLGLVGDVEVGGTAHAVAAVVDPGAAFETYTCTSINYGDGSALRAGTWVPDGWTDGLPRCVFPDHSYAASGTYTLVATVTDSGGAKGSASFSETVLSFPALTAPPDQTVHSADLWMVSGSHTWDLGSFTDASNQGPWYVTVDWGDGQVQTKQTWVQGPLSEGHLYYPGGTYDVTVTVINRDGMRSEGHFRATFIDDGPTVMIAASPMPANEGEPYENQNAYWTMGWEYCPMHWHVDWGDGTTTDFENCQPGMMPDPMHTYAAGLPTGWSGSTPYTAYQATMTVTDTLGRVGSGTWEVDVYDVAPFIEWPGVVTVPQGFDGQIPVAFTDASIGPWTVTMYGGTPWQIVQTFDQPGVIQIPFLASMGTTVVDLTVVDQAGMGTSVPIFIEIGDVAPTVGEVSVAGYPLEGQFMSAQADFTDPGWGTETYTCEVTYGDGSDSVAGIVVGGTCQGPAHQYVEAGEYQVSVVVGDSGGEYAWSSTTVSVANVSPGVGPVSIGESVEGQPVAAWATFADPGSGAETYTCTVDYGDGSGGQAGTVNGTTCQGPSHTYDRPGTFTVTITVRDSAGGSGSAAASAFVANVLPTVSTFSVTPGVAKIGSSVTASMAFTDPGSNETYSLIWEWGDGSTEGVQLGSSRSASATHNYAAAGLYPVSLLLADGPDWTAATWGVLPVFDPARTLSGSGSIVSPAGACSLSSRCASTSVATFSVSAKYAKGAVKPTVTLTYSALGFKVSATSADWFVAAKGSATIQGTCKVNGVAGYSFRLAAFDARPDTLALSVFDAAGNMIYGTEATKLKSGSITIK